MSAFGSCLALALTLGSLPPLPIGDLLGTIPSVSNLTIATVAPRSITEFNFSAVGASLFFPSGATFQVNADLTSSDGVAGLTLNVTVDPGIASFVNTVQPGTCLIDKVVVSQCSLRGRITGVVYPINGGIPEDFNAAFLDGIIQAVAKYINNQSTCGGYADVIAKLVTAIPDDEPATLPPAPEFPSMCDLRNSPLMNMATDVISHLPTLFGMRFGLSVPTANAVRATIVEVEGTHGPLTIPGTTDWIQIPANTGLSMDLVFTKVLCPAANSIEILDNVTVMNIRLTDAEGNSVARLFDDIDSGLGTIATDLLRMLSRSVPPEDAPILLTIPTHDGKTAPFYTMAIVASASLILGLSASFVAWRRHRGKLLLDQHGQPVSRLAFFIGDAILIVGCCSTIVCFAWSNQTGAATVRLGGTFDLYNFGLADSVRDMWSAGLYALSFFIALFCGFYPYFKLLSILLFSVVLQRPQSKVLHFIDLCGKFSLLDSFVMIILAEGLTVPGIVQVEMGPSFWVFLGATVSSMALGNYATHGWRAEVPLADSVTLQLESSPVLGGDRMPRAINYRGAYVEDMAPASPIRASTAISLAGGGSDANLDPNRFRPIIAGLSFVMMVVVLGLPALFDTIEFQNGGVGALVTGATNRYTLVRLIGKCPTGLIATAYISIFIMPLLFAAGYRKSRVLAAWCAPDAFLLACVAALFQLNQFVVFVLGSAFKGVITINAALLWPIYALGGAVALLWLLIVGLLFR